VLRRATRLKDDAIMGVVLGGGFGLGIALLGVAQSLPGGNQAGLESFIYGRTASMVRSDAVGIGVTACVALLVSALLAKEFRLLCFDEAFGRSIGRRERLLDLGLMLLAVGVTVVGLQAVGLILVIALLIIPAAAARFWTDNFIRVVVLAGFIGAGACWVGASISALAPKLPAGAIIVLTLAGMFCVSMALGARRGGIRRVGSALLLRKRTGRQHLLRAASEFMESSGCAAWRIEDLRPMRSWSASRLAGLHRKAARTGDIQRSGRGWTLTPSGAEAAARVVRNHRLWEIFLIRHADIAASHVDRDADFVEHVLGDELVAELESMLDTPDPPRSPHPIRGSA
jgi:manganese/zinc/iron transport system permease protein